MPVATTERSGEPRALSCARSENTLLLSVDFEDWHQLVRRRVGVRGWEVAGPALPRQTAALLELLDQLEVKATFFILGMAARAHPALVEEIARRGHEIGCHGDAHRPVHRQTPAEFAADLRSARETIEHLTGRSPAGYRAPAFSITGDSRWAFQVLVDEGFSYDASEHDTPRLRARVGSGAAAPHRLQLAHGSALWEFPVAVWRIGRGRVPVGGASYWGVLPEPVVLLGLRRAGPFAGLYVHPHELDPEPLCALLPPGSSAAQQLHAAVRAAQRNSARRTAAGTLRAIAGRFELIPYGEAHARLANGTGTAART